MRQHVNETGPSQHSCYDVYIPTSNLPLSAPTLCTIEHDLADGVLMYTQQLHQQVIVKLTTLNTYLCITLYMQWLDMVHGARNSRHNNGCTFCYRLALTLTFYDWIDHRCISRRNMLDH